MVSWPVLLTRTDFRRWTVLRAISIGLVVFGHVLKTSDALSRMTWLGYLAGFGVRTFFVISGFLISTLLFHEMKKTGRISLGKFYFRRTFRIFPAFYAYVAVIAALAAAGKVELLPGDILHAVTYTTNYHHDRSWYLGHLWSLSVEEQFYLLWPAALLLLGRKPGLYFAASMLVISPMLRVASMKFHIGAETGIGETFQTICDTLATGCLLAGLRDWLEASPRYLAFLDSPFFFFVPVVALALTELGNRPSLDFTVGQTITNIGIAFTVHWCLRHYDGVVGRVLNSRSLSYIGTLSYSIYLWQQPFMHPLPGVPWTVLPLNILAMTAAALISYYLVERPLLRAREKIETRIFKPSVAVTPSRS